MARTAVAAAASQLPCAARAVGAPRVQPRARPPVLQARRRSALSVRAGAAGELPLPSAISRVLLNPPTGQRMQQKENVWSLEEAADEAWQRDEIKEQDRRHMRELSSFTFRRWAFHRSGSRYLRHMAGIFQSRIVRGLAQPILSAATAATLVCVYETLITDGVLPDTLPTFLMPSLPFDVTSFALSLLLVFRTNTSYDRWLEAVTAWGNISTRSRDTLRQLLAYSGQAPTAADTTFGNYMPTPPGAGEGAAAAVAAGASAAVQSASAVGKWLVAFSCALKAQLTEDSDLKKELQGVLTASELELLLGAYHRPSFALAVLSELTAAAPLRDSQRMRVDENLTFFDGCVSNCERILRTPIPLSYTRHTSRFMVMWLSCLPLGLWHGCGWGTIPLTITISFLLLGIEEIGVAIEEPFSILPLEDLCHEIEFGLTDILEQAAPSKRAAQQAAAAAAAGAAAAAAAAAAATATPAQRMRGASADFVPAEGLTAEAAQEADAGAAAGGPAGVTSAPVGVALAAANGVSPFSSNCPNLLALRRNATPSSAALLSEAIFSSVDDSDS